MDIRINVEGHVDDLYALALLFPEGAIPALHVVTELKGEKDGWMDRVTDATNRRTWVTGEGCLPLLEARDYGAAGWVAGITSLHLGLNFDWEGFLNSRKPKDKRKLVVGYIPVT